MSEVTQRAAQSAISGTRITLGAQAAKAGLQLASVAILARLLSPRDFGLVASVTAIVALTELFRDFGLFTAALQAPHLSRTQQSNLFWLNLATGTVCAGLFAAGAPLLGVLYGDERLVNVALILSLVFLINGLSTQYRASLNRQKKYWTLAASDVGSQAVGVTAAICMAIIGLGYWALVYQLIITYMTVLIVTSLSAGWVPRRPARGHGMLPLIRFGRNFLGSRFALYLPTNMDNVAISATIGPEPLGYYSRAFQVVSMPISYISSPLMRIALPTLTATACDRGRFKESVLAFQSLICYASGIIYGILAGGSGPIAAILFGQGWSDVAPLIAVLAVGSFFRSLSVICDWCCLAVAATSRQLSYTARASLLWTVGVIAAAPFGVVAVAGASAAGALLFWALYLRTTASVTQLSAHDLGCHALVRIVLVPLPVGSIAYISTYIPIADPLQLVAAFSIATLYLGLVILLSPTVRADLSSLLTRQRMRA